jgi:hypothetical protein
MGSYLTAYGLLHSCHSSCIPQPRQRRPYGGALLAFDLERSIFIVGRPHDNIAHLTALCLLDWLPNHVLVMTIIVCFALLNPLVIPFALVYFSVESGAFAP